MTCENTQVTICRDFCQILNKKQSDELLKILHVMKLVLNIRWKSIWNTCPEFFHWLDLGEKVNSAKLTFID